MHGRLHGSMRRPPPSLRGRALMWLAQREHTRQELAQKLQRWLRALQSRADVQASASAGGEAHAGLPDATSLATPSAGDIPALLDALQTDGHLSNERFVESRINARRARFGNRRIEQELRHHGAALSEPLRAELRASEADRARRVLAARFSAPAADAAERLRQMRFLAGRGFSAEVIRRVIAGAQDDTADA